MQAQERIEVCPLCKSYSEWPPQSAEDELRLIKHLMLMHAGLTV